MRAGRAICLALLLIAIPAAKVSAADDIYLEDQDGDKDEFLEVKDDHAFSGITRIKRAFDWWSPFSLITTTTTAAPENIESITEDQDDTQDNNDYDSHSDGSGAVPVPRFDPDPTEKTLRVTFVVMEPFLDDYSNRDSELFQTFSHNLADAVNKLFEDQPGTQKASLVRIQSRPADNFSCKVTLDIVTTAEDTDRMVDKLRVHIRNTRTLGDYTLTDADFSANVIMPGSSFELCRSDELQCNDGRCIPGSARCDGAMDCYDGADERDCPVDASNEQTDQNRDDTNQVDTFGPRCEKEIPCPISVEITICPEDFCNGIRDCPDGEDESPDRCGSTPSPDVGLDRGDQSLSNNFDTETTTYPPRNEETTSAYIPEVDETACLPGEFRCDETRCIMKHQVCDQEADCNDGTDESACPPKSCGRDDFVCNNNKCIESYRRCDRVFDCPDQEDEVGCDCPPDAFICPAGSSTTCARRCDYNSECDNGEDEEGCNYFEDDCQTQECDGRCLDNEQICDGKPDCSDGADERFCDKCDGPEDFRCDDGECIKLSERCNQVFECNDESDERLCDVTVQTRSDCLDGQVRCADGFCLNNEFLCDGRPDCYDGSDEIGCPPNKTITTPAPIYTTTNRETYNSGGASTGYSPYAPRTDRPRTNDDYTPNGDNSYDSNSDRNNVDNWETTTSSYTPNGYPPYDRNPSTEPPYKPYYPSPYPASDRNPPYNQNPSTEPPYNPYPSGNSNQYPGSDNQSGGRYPYGSSSNQGGQGQPDNRDDQSGSRYPYDSSSGQGGRPDDRYDQSGSRYPYGSSTGQGGRPEDRYDQSGSRYPYDSSGQGRRPGDRYDQSGSAYPYDTSGQGGQTENPDDNEISGYPNGFTTSSPNYPRYPDSNAGSGSNYPVRGPISLDLKSYPLEQNIRYVNFGGDVVFICRDEGPLRAPVRWIREGGRPLKPGSSDKGGRLEMNTVTLSDSGVYICQAPKYLGSAGSEIRVTLSVDQPQRHSTTPPFVVCKPFEATCSNGECIPKSAVCDGKVDCSDRSDEDTCNYDGKCEPNQFQCENRKCVLKSWLCDSDDDCGDGSDEKSCPAPDPRANCYPMEFACSTNSQCIPRSFHCDGNNDCIDGSDEIGCSPVYISKPPKPSNVQLNPGDTLSLTCEAVGVPVPIISWRLNWGHVPDKCYSTNNNGIGTLTCPNMQVEDSGAYSCEAINHKGTTFATPDAIVFVTQTSPCPEGSFNNEARTRSECISCFCFGRATRCHSADLFTYNMPTPLGEGGTRLLGVALSGDGAVRTDNSIINHYFFSAIRNGATITKLETRDPNWLGNYHPFLTLPESYNGNQLTSYGGYIKYKLHPHTTPENDEIPSIIVKGKYATLYHVPRGNMNGREYMVEARFLPEYWQKADSNGNLIPVQRADIMMALDNITMILIRGDNNNAGVNITDFVMESAQSINSGQGAANLVEECSCPEGYSGLSCEKCKPGYIRENSGPWLGQCVRMSCPPGSYGDPSMGDACKPCPCPLTNKENQFATTCSVGSDGSVNCDCFPGYEGKNCEKCSQGFEGNPLVYGNRCTPRPTHNCNEMGTERRVQLMDECVCKDNVQGRYCDQCRNGSFYLSNDFRHGCALCFCSGESQLCMSSNLRRKTTEINFNVPSIVDNVRVYNTLPQDGGNFRYTEPVETSLRPQLTRSGLGLSGIDSSRQTVYYWSMPASFAGDKVTAYGGYLRYTLDNVPSYVSSEYKNKAADVQLISDNHLRFQYFGDFKPSHDVLNVSIQLLEKGWQRSDGKEIPRELFLLALADVKTILIKATYSAEAIATPLYASIDTAAADGDGPAALHVEQCVCPPGYVGTSCEDCAPGFTRGSGGIYLAHCEECQCNGHSTNCHPENGECYNCLDNTMGPRCELCKPGYERDGYDNCRAIENLSSTSQPCYCDPRGADGSCDAYGQCNCKRNVEGENCDRCRAGTFGLDIDNFEGCLPCYCSGATTECQEANFYYREAIPAPILGENYGGYTVMDFNGKTVINDHFVPVPDKSELMYVFPFPADTGLDLYWSLPVFAGNRILSYGGNLSLRQEFKSNDYNYESRPGDDVILIGDDISIAWYNPNTLQSGVPLSYQVPLSEKGWTILNTGEPVTRSNFMRVLKNLRRVLVKATLAPNIVSTSIADVSMDTASQIYQPNAQLAKNIEMCMCPPGHFGTSCESCVAGYYKDRQDFCVQCPCNGHDCQLDTYGQVQCNCRPPYTGRDCSAIGGDSQTNQVTTNRPPLEKSTITVKITSEKIAIREVGSSVNFTCEAHSDFTRRLIMNWTKVDGDLPQGRSYVNPYTGLLTITNLQLSDSGQYVCQSSDGRSTQQEYATLKVPANRMTLPTVEIRPAPVSEIYVGDRIQLECVTTGSPKPTVSWQRAARRPLPLEAQIYGNIFVIENAKLEDAGEYRCMASNTLGMTDGFAVINIRPRPSRPKVDRLVVSPESPTVNEGQSIRVVCTGSTNVRAGSLDWVRQDQDRFQNNVHSDNGVLYIEEARPENAGVYVCQTDSTDVAPQPILLTVVSTATQSPDQVPAVEVPVRNLRIPSGSSEKVDCYPRGEPLPLVRWSKYEGQFSSGVSQRGNSLILNEVGEDDAGYYQCQGLDPYDKRVVNEVFVYLEIERREKPLVEIWPPGEQPVALGNTSFEFHCRVLSGIPAPAVTWSRASGRALSPHAQLLTNNILRFSQIEVNDEGEYICTGDNSVGSFSASAVIKVRSPPEITITPTDYMVINNGEPITVDCRAEGYPEPTVNIRGPDQSELASGSRIASLRVPSASARDEGEYTCVASNPAGTNTEAFLVRIEDRGDGGTDFGGSGDFGIDPDSQNNQYPYPNPDENPYYPNPPPRPRPDDPHIPLERTIIEGTDASIECKVVPPGLIPKWVRGEGRPMEPNVQQIDNMLIIRNVTKADAGVYVCMGHNYETGSSSTALYTNIRVVSKPKITLHPKSQVVQPGNSPTVECIVEGDDVVEILWKPTNKPFSRRVRVKNATLIFQQIETEDAGLYLCIARSRFASASATAEVRVVGAPAEKLVQIEQPRRAFRVGENVNVLCKSTGAFVAVEWIKRDDQGNRQYVDSDTYGDGSVLRIMSVGEHDAGVYQCIGKNRFGLNYTDNFNLDIVPGSAVTSDSEPNVPVREYTARLRQSIDMPCYHNLEGEVTVHWKREYVPLPSEIRNNQPILHIDSVNEDHAGTYVCRISNGRISMETKAILRVIGIIPSFDGESWIALPALKEAYRQFDIEISFKPLDTSGLILYNSQNPGRATDFLALQLIDGKPEFTLETGSGPVSVTGDRALGVNTWHTIRLNKIGSRVTMDVDNNGPFMVDTPENWVLELSEPLYIGGVPDYNQLPSSIAGAEGFTGCVSMLVLGHEEKNIMMEQLDEYRVDTCDTCADNLCENSGVCQESRTERGYTCLCPPEFAGTNCERRGEGCRPGICGPGRCSNTVDGYKCACPATHTGRNCENTQQIEYPAFTGQAYVALKPPNTARFFKMSMKIKATAPVSDGIIMYCAESPRGIGGFTSLAVKYERLEFRFELGEGNPAILVSNETLPADEWTDVQVTRSGPTVSLIINLVHNYEQRLESTKSLKLETPMFVGGVDDSIILNNNVGITSGFMGCIKDLKTQGSPIDIVKDPNVESANLKECSNFSPRGDIPAEADNTCRCNNGGTCAADGSCVCPPGFSGYYCETRQASSLRNPRPPPTDPCAVRPCRNGGYCRPDYTASTLMNHTCDCPLGFSGASCQMRLELINSVGFNGNGYLELPHDLVEYENLESRPAAIMIRVITTKDGVLVYHRETNAQPNTGDFLMIRIERGYVVLEFDMGSGPTTLTVSSGFVGDGERHSIVVRLLPEGQVELAVDGVTERAYSNGFANRMNADSNIYIGGIPERLNVYRYPGFSGCIDQVEFMDTGRGVDLGHTAVTGRNTQPCRY